jgi:hypothetical protein
MKLLISLDQTTRDATSWDRTKQQKALLVWQLTDVKTPLIDVRHRGKSGHCSKADPSRLLTDAVEKGKNELTEIFLCVPVETGIS